MIETPPSSSTSPRARAIFALLCLASVIAIAVYIALAPASSGPGSRPDGAAADVPTVDVAAVPDRPSIMFRHAGPGRTFGHLALLPIAAVEEAATTGVATSDATASGTAASGAGASGAGASGAGAPAREIAPLSCERLHYAAGQGVCMVMDDSRMPVRYEAWLFDHTFQRRHTLPLTGPPIRARVSPDGRRAALTVFESGHSYADADFSTKTIVVETESGRVLGDLEEFAVTRQGAPFKAIDFNFWGVTFARDGDTFYATLKTGGSRYLVKGSVDARRATVMREGVECPSLSPDERSIVFKKPMVSEVGWRLYVLDLASGRERPLTRLPRSVDDQVDWFDAARIVYHDSPREGAGIWLLAIDDATPPRLLIPGAYSPAVLR